MTFRLQNLLRTNRPVAFLVILHAAAWALFIFYEFMMLYLFSGKLGRVGDSLLYYVLHILLFYLQAYFILPHAFSPRKAPYLVCLLLVMAELAGYLLAKYAIDYYVGSFKLSISDATRITRYILINSWRGLYFVGIGSVYWMTRRIFTYHQAIAEADKRELSLLREKAEVERNLAEVNYAYLQQQIRPHFLFNTLNFIYNSVYKLSPVASDYVLQLSEMMRYSFREPDASGRAPLGEEIEQITSLIGINRIRFDHKLYISFVVSGNAEDKTIIPLVLLTLVENVFKHGNLKDEGHPALISLSINEHGWLKFNTWNLKKMRNAAQKINTIGLENTIKRLDYAYSSNYRLNTADNHESYQLELYLQL